VYQGMMRQLVLPILALAAALVEEVERMRG
jgi:hypothetical protein